MKVNELISDFRIYMTNEEKSVYDQLEGVVPLVGLTEREQFIIDNLVRKSLVSKIHYKNQIVVTKNDQ